MKKLLSFALVTLFVISLTFVGGCRNSRPNVNIAECENGTIILHENLAWIPNYSLYSDEYLENDCFEAVPDEGYYFEKWVFLDKKHNDIGYLGYHDHNFNFISKRLLETNYTSDNKNSDKVAYVKAIFTNDQSKLIDVSEPELNIQPTDISINNLEFETNTLPDKKVDGTYLFKYVILKDKNLVITDIDSLMTAKYDSISGMYIQDVVTYENNNNLYQKGTYAYMDYEYNEVFESRIVSITIFVSKAK